MEYWWIYTSNPEKPLIGPFDSVEEATEDADDVAEGYPYRIFKANTADRSILARQLVQIMRSDTGVGAVAQQPTFGNPGRQSIDAREVY